MNKVIRDTSPAGHLRVRETDARRAGEMAKLSQIEVDVVWTALASEPAGLTSAEADARLARFG